jgi:predicted component of type VI protein secretion system
LAIVFANAQGATKEEIMASRYMRYLACMGRAHGQYFHEKYNIEMQLNRWGVSEPTLSSLSKQSPEFQKSEAGCRRENEIQFEARPK